ncbi:hypothetical protein HJFPF1_01427 [Paramyrothecium foliicola]|nr:hypothetical protein HJFPF1_01427 [Paramyrothecium foliicola]
MRNNGAGISAQHPHQWHTVPFSNSLQQASTPIHSSSNSHIPNSSMATAETVDLGPSHPPKEDSIEAFNAILPDLKRELVRIRRDHQKHEPEYFAAADNLNDEQLAGFSADNLEAVRVAVSAYGIHLFAKVRIPALPEAGPSYIHIRIFTTGADSTKLHSIHTEERDAEGGGKTYRAIFTRDDELEWFDT